MNTEKITKFTLAALTVAVVATIGLTKHTANYMTIMSIVVSYLTVAAMLLVAGTDARSTKRLE
ncbi:MAG TPA: hypothetical protein VFJ90_14770 [Candidatus Didemnitutus sp.]|nr:hypothetical protein [Candidatus Didemnitutus sp.]